VARDARSAFAVAATLLALLAFVPGASADEVIAEAGEGAGQVQNPLGLAVDTEVERLYVADQGNNRIDVFDAATGDFEMAFGWGVADGSAELQTCTATCLRGIAGSGAGQLSAPTGVGVDSSSHNVYVVDPNNFRIQKFTPGGEFLLTFGGGVNQTTSGDICTAVSGDLCGAGSDGTGEGEFSSSNLYVGVSPGGIVDIAESRAGGLDANHAYRIQSFEPSGVVIPPQLDLPEGERRMSAFAADSVGSSYVATGGGIAGSGIRKYPPGYAPGDPVPPLISAAEIGALGVDSADNLLSAGPDGSGSGVSYQTIAQYDSGGVGLRRFGYGAVASRPEGLAAFDTPSGQVYASAGNKLLYLAYPDPGPIVAPAPCRVATVGGVSTLGNTKATLAAQVNPEGKATTFHFQYVEEKSFQTEGGWASPKTKVTPESESLGSDINLHQADAKVTGLTPETTYRCRVIAANADAPGGVIGEEGAFTTLEPFEILGTWASAVGTEAATLNATVNPLGLPTTGYFEYVDDAAFKASGFTEAEKAPPAEVLDFGSGEKPQSESAQLSGLEPGALYHYRVVVDDPLVEPRVGPTQTVRTFRSAFGGLPDDRAYELVSPAQKNSAEVAVPGAAGGLFLDTNVRIQAAATTGEAVTYTSWTSFGDAKAAAAASQYLSKRTAGGWSTENISPPGVLANALVPPFVGFTPDLSLGAFKIEEPPLTEDALTGFPNLYLRDNSGGALRALTTEAPAGGKAFSCLSYAGASADAQHVIFSANASFAGAPEAKGNAYNLYEWSAADGLPHLVSVLPGGAAAKPAAKTTFGATGGGAIGGNCEVGTKIIRHAISADGSRIFWSHAPTLTESQLMARVGGVETIQLDATQGAAAGPAGSGQFWSASADGSKVFFTAPGKLTADAGASSSAPDLYRYDFEAPPGERLEDLTPGSLTPGAEAAGVQGVVGASEDGSSVYFAARGVLSGEEENDHGAKAEAGERNLYLWRQGEAAPRFIATGLSEVDASNWNSSVKTQTARVSPDGRHLAFVSSASLTGYDNTGEGSPSCAPRCAEAYLYDAEAEELICASCNPSGARPLDRALLPTWSNPYEQPHYLSDDGSRLFFETGDALDPADVNEKLDVYEFEREGSGSCDTESATFDSISGGCLYLISSGKSEDDSYLVDASTDGRDVFFSTRQSLLESDENENYDIYDARAGGGFPELPPPPPPCPSPEACRAPATAPPVNTSPGTPDFRGTGNASGGRPRPCRKGKVRRRGRCVDRQSKPRQQKKRHKNSNRGMSR
jgi:hypothetical protein